MAAAGRIVFMGSPAFAVPTLRALVEHGHHVAAVITQPDRPAGRGGRVHMPPVKTTALEFGIPVLQPDSLKDLGPHDRIAAFNPEAFVVAAYGKILPKALLALPRVGSLNVHGSLLPRWRGPSPVSAAILAGDTETGISIMELVAKMDAGPVLTRHPVAVSQASTTGSLERELAEVGAAALVNVLPRWLAGDVQAVPQNEQAATYCHLVHKEDGHLRRDMTADEAERAVRAYDPWPGAFVMYQDARLGIWRAKVEPGDVTPGAVSVRSRRPAVAFTGGWLVLQEVQRPGSRRVSGEQFLNGERGRLATEVGLA